MVEHGAPALLLLRFFLPAALLFASCFVFTLPSFVYLVAFLYQHYRPKYEVTHENYPTAYLLFLSVYSLILIIVHIVLGALATTQSFFADNVALAITLAIPDYHAYPWTSVKLLLSPVVVLCVAVAVLNTSSPLDGERFFKIGRGKDDSTDDTSETSHSSRSIRHFHSRSFNTFETEATPALLSQEPLRKFTIHMAGRGGIFWTTITCGFTGLSYSSIFTLVYLAAFSLVVVAWAFHSTRLHPRRFMYNYVITIKWFRRFMLSYLLFIGVLQNASFVQFAEDKTSNYDVVQSIFRLIGFVQLNTLKPEGWAHVTGFCFAIATYVLSGIFVNALSKVLAARQDTQSEIFLGEDRLSTALNYYDIQFLHIVLHLSSVGLLTWSLVFPGLLTLPMLLASLAYFTSRRVRNSRVFDRIIVYAIVLQIAHFLFVAVSASFESVDTDSTTNVIRWLGLRKFQPQFTMNLVQALALGLFCTNIFCKRYIAEALSRTGRENPGGGELNVSEFVHNAAYSATALKQRAVYSMIRLILDCLSLTSLYIAAGAEASLLNSVFLAFLVVLCVLQAFGGAKAPRVMRYLWYMILFHSTIFLIITCTACRAIKEEFPLQCESHLYGILPASNAQVVAYAATIIFSAIQVHFTWIDPESGSGTSRDEYRSLFWSLVRKYYLFLTYVALLLYPLVHPANLLSYGYVLFLAISIVVELVGPYIRRDTQSIRTLIKSYWPAVVLFSVCALVSRYIIRFEGFSNTDQLIFARKWIFGFDRIDSIDEFHFTVGDASMLILVSLQGRFFGIENIIDEAQKERKRAKKLHSNDQSHAVEAPRQIPLSEVDPSGSTSYAIGSGVQSGIRRRTSAPGPPASATAFSSLSRRVSFLHSQMRYPDDGSNGRLRTGTDGEKFLQFQERIMKWRMSLPVKQTEKFCEAVYSYSLVLVRNSLLHYSFVLEACAILAAAVWLPGFSVFGGVYIILGCVLLLSEQASHEKKGLPWMNQNHRLSQLSQESQASSSTGVIMRMLPVVLSILSFTLMSLQYVFMVAGKIRADSLQEHDHVFQYFGLRSSVKGLPIDEPAMLAHVLVFLTAFLQRVAVKWAQNDARKKMKEEQDYRGLSGFFLDPLQSQRALDTAVNINEALFTVEPPVSRATDNHESDASSESFNEEGENQKQVVIDSTSVPLAGLSISPSSIGKEVKMNPEVDFAPPVPESESPPDRSEESSEQEVVPDASSKLKQRLNTLFAKIREILFDCYSILNPFWVMWGFDLTFMYLVIGGSVTRTSFAVIYVGLVMLTSGHQRRKIAPYWHLITLLLTCLVLLQYFMTLGFPSRNQYKTIPESSWYEWLYLDSRNDTVDRKYDVTFAFLSVICASMTLNAVAPGPRGVRFWCRKAIPNPRTWPPQAQSEQRKDDEEIDDVGRDKVRNDADIEKSSSSDRLGLQEKESIQNELVPEQLWEREEHSYDFTTRPMSTRDLIKLYSMRYSGSLVQLYMFATAVAVTSVFTGLLLFLSFYFLFNFTQVETKRQYFFIVRFYVLSVVFIIVVYQAPFPPIERPWAEVLGLFKTGLNSNGRLLLSLLVSLWVLCQVQGRIYESDGFKYIVKYGEEDEKLRFKRAVHDHNTRKYERMLGRNKYRRARSARDGRLKRLMKLKNGDKRSVDQLYQVCVVDEMNWLRSKVERGKGKEFIFSSHVKQKKEEEEEKESWIRRLLRFLFRGRTWRKYSKHPLTSEARLFFSRYSAWSVYATMLLATVVHPTELTAVYPLFLFLYLIVEQPRPPKKVWQFLMIYVCVVITGKYVAKYVIPLNINCDVGFVASRTHERKDCRVASGILFDILIFLALLWHRTVLYNRGLWDLDTTEEEMILASEIHGEKVQTDPEMMITTLPSVPETLGPSSPAPFRLFSGKDFSDMSTSHADPVSAMQQCSDVSEVFRRSSLKLYEMSGKTESVKGSDETHPPNDGDNAKRERRVVFQPTTQSLHATPDTTGLGPNDSYSALPVSTALREFTRQFSMRASRNAEARTSPEVPLDPAQSIVHQSLLESKVIRQREDKAGISGSLSVFHSHSKTGFISGVMDHFRKLTKEQEHKAVGDYYILIFLVDFFSFVFVTFGFASIFGDDTGRQLPWWRANFIEITHLLTLIAMFFALVVDRVVYLTRSMRGKLILQYVSVVVYHVVIFFLPGRNQNIWNNALAKIFYMLRCVYFLLSGLQIRNGFPKYTTAQFLLRNFSTPGIILFEIYNFIPFLWLMRTLLDWAVVPTSLEIFQYIRFIDIYIWLYRNRAVNTSRGQFRRKLGQHRRWLPRIYQGFGIFLLCALALFVPFLFFSVLNPFVSARDPNLATLKVSLRVPVSSDGQTLASYNIFSRTTFIPRALGRTETRQVAGALGLDDEQIKITDREENFLADFGTISDEQWDIPDVSRRQLARAVSNFSQSSPTATPSLFYEVTAKTNSEDFKLQKTIALTPDEGTAIGDSILNGTSIGLKLKQAVPLFGVLESGDSRFKAEEPVKNRTLCLRHVYSQEVSTDTPNDSVWTLQSCGNASCRCPPTLNNLSTSRNRFVLKFAVVSHLQVGGTTILTMYVAILFTLANFMRGFFSDKRLIIPYIDMPYTLHLFQLVLDIIYARQDNQLDMEEILYNGLIDIYRDSHVLAKWTGERALKLPTEWWQDSEYEGLGEVAYQCYPSFAATQNEPYMTRIVD